MWNLGEQKLWFYVQPAMQTLKALFDLVEAIEGGGDCPSSSSFLPPSSSFSSSFASSSSIPPLSPPNPLTHPFPFLLLPFTSFSDHDAV